MGPPEKRDHYLKQVASAEERLERIILSILDFSDLNLTHGELRLEPAVLDTLLGEIVAARAEMAGAHGQRLEWTPQGDGLRVLVDVQLVRKALDNIVVNALLYTPPGGRVRVWTELDAGRQDGPVAIHVSDTGQGIPEGDLPHLFEPLIRGSEQGSGHIAGIGLGLPTAARIIGWHNGLIRVSSTVGEGSTFSVLLPCESLVPINSR